MFISRQCMGKKNPEAHSSSACIYTGGKQRPSDICLSYWISKGFTLEIIICKTLTLSSKDTVLWYWMVGWLSLLTHPSRSISLRHSSSTLTPLLGSNTVRQTHIEHQLRKTRRNGNITLCFLDKLRFRCWFSEKPEHRLLHAFRPTARLMDTDGCE